MVVEEDLFTDDLGDEETHRLVGEFVFGEVGRALGQLGEDLLEYVLDVGVVLGGDGEHRGGWQLLFPVFHSFLHAFLVGEVDLVDQHEDGGLGAFQPFDGLLLDLLVGDIDHEEDEVGVDEGDVDELVHDLVHLVGWIFDDARGVGEDDLEVVAVDDAEDAVSRGLGL